MSQARGYAIGSGIGRWARRKVWRVSRYGSAGPEVATTAATSGSAAPARIAPIAPIEWPITAPVVTSGRATRARNAASASEPNSPALIGRVSGALAPWPRTSIVRQWKPAAWRKTTFGRLRSRADSQPWMSATPGPG